MNKIAAGSISTIACHPILLTRLCLVLGVPHHIAPQLVLAVGKLAEVPIEAGALLLEVAADLGLEAGVGALVTCVRDIDTLAEAAKAGNFVSVFAKFVAYLRSFRQVQLKLRGFKVLWKIALFDPTCVDVKATHRCGIMCDKNFQRECTWREASIRASLAASCADISSMVGYLG